MAGHFVHPWPPGRAWLGRGSPAEPPTAFPGARDPRRAERLARGDAGHPLLPSLHQRPLLDTRLVPGTIAGPEDTEAQWACPRPCFPLTLGGRSLRGVDPQRLLGTPSGRVRGHREDGTSRSRPMHAAPPGHSPTHGARPLRSSTRPSCPLGLPPTHTPHRLGGARLPSCQGDTSEPRPEAFSPRQPRLAGRRLLGPSCGRGEAGQGGQGAGRRRPLQNLLGTFSEN